MPKIIQDPPRPAGGEVYQGGGNHQPREDPDAKQAMVHDVESNGEQEAEDPCAPIENICNEKKVK